MRRSTGLGSDGTAGTAQVVLPLGEQPGGRAGRHPAQDSQAYPLAGRVVEGVTGEPVCVRRELDLGAVRDSLQARIHAAAPLPRLLCLSRCAHLS